MANTENFPKISAAQLFCLLLLSRISAEIVYPRCGAGFGGETMLAVIAAELVRFVLGLPVIVFAFRGKSFYGAIWRKSRFLGWASAFGAAALLLGAGVRTITSVTRFASRNLLLGAPTYIMIGFTIIFAVYAAFMGIEALARSGVIFLVGAGVITLIVILADIPYMEWGGVMPPQRAEYAEFFEDVFERILRGGDYLIFAVLLPYVNTQNNITRGSVSLWFALFSGLIAVLLCGFYCLTLRELYGLVEFPFTAAASLSDIVLFKRLDGIGGAVWTLCASFRAGLLLYCAWGAIREIRRAKKIAENNAPAGKENA